MKRYARSALFILAMTAAGIAAQPYIRFLVAPPDDQAGRWVATVVALCILAAAVLALRGARARGREK